MPAENEKLKFCFVGKRDWRLCKAEVRFGPSLALYVLRLREVCTSSFQPRTSPSSELYVLIAVVVQMAMFRACWAKHGNTSRTSQADV
jgi:hypothetical protein